jgi:hypothetical protein
VEILQETALQLLSIILGGLIAIATAYVGLWVSKVTQKAKIEVAKLEDERVQAIFENALDKTERLIQTNIIAMENTVKKELIEKAMIDGKIDREELKQLAVEVKVNVLNQLTDGTLDVLNGGIGDLNSYLEMKIEEELANIKNNYSK